MPSQIAKENILVRDLVNLLFEVLVRPNGKPYSVAEVARETGIVEGSLRSLKVRDYKTVTLATLQALATFFDIPIEYFTCETLEDARSYLARVKAGIPIHDPDEYIADELIPEIMTKAMSLSIDARQDLLRMMQWLEYGDKHRPKSERVAAESG